MPGSTQTQARAKKWWDDVEGNVTVCVAIVAIWLLVDRAYRGSLYEPVKSCPPAPAIKAFDCGFGSQIDPHANTPDSVVLETAREFLVSIATSMKERGVTEETHRYCTKYSGHVDQAVATASLEGMSYNIVERIGLEWGDIKVSRVVWAKQPKPDPKPAEPDWSDSGGTNCGPGMTSARRAFKTHYSAPCGYDEFGACTSIAAVYIPPLYWKHACIPEVEGVCTSYAFDGRCLATHKTVEPVPTPTEEAEDDEDLEWDYRELWPGSQPCRG